MTVARVHGGSMLIGMLGNVVLPSFSSSCVTVYSILALKSSWEVMKAEVVVTMWCALEWFCSKKYLCSDNFVFLILLLTITQQNEERWCVADVFSVNGNVFVLAQRMTNSVAFQFRQYAKQTVSIYKDSLIDTPQLWSLKKSSIFE